MGTGLGTPAPTTATNQSVAKSPQSPAQTVPPVDPGAATGQGPSIGFGPNGMPTMGPQQPLAPAQNNPIGDGFNRWRQNAQNAQAAQPQPQTSSPLDQLYSMYQQQYNQGMNGLDQQWRLGLDSFQGRDAYLGRQQGYANTDYGFALNDLNTKRSLTDIDLRNQGANLPLYDELAAMRQNYRPLYQQDLDTRLGQIGLDETQKHQQAQSAATAGGFGFAPGVSTGQHQITQGADYERDSARNNFAKQSLGLDIDSKNDLIKKNMEQGSYDKLQATAASYGTDAATLYSSLQQKLDGLGMSRQNGVEDLFRLMSSTNTQQQALGNQIMQSIMGQVNEPNSPYTADDITRLGQRASGGIYGILNRARDQMFGGQ